MSDSWKCGKQFIEFVNPDDIELGEVKEVYPKLRECYQNSECRSKNLYMDEIPLEFLDEEGLWSIKLHPLTIVLIKRDGKLTVAEGKHRVKMAKEMGLKGVLARVEYQC